MPVDPVYRADPRFPDLGPEFSDAVAPAAFPETVLRHRNDRWAKRVGLSGLSDAEWIRHFGRFEPLPDNIAPPRAMRYHGHQFQAYNPELGDGRGFLFAQLRDDRGRLLDFGTKGSGQTPYSRRGDGRLTLKGGVREVLAASFLEALEVDTSKAFSLVETGEKLWRDDEPSPTRSAVLVRLSHSHIRFGTFQRHAYFDAKDHLRALVAHCLELYYPDVRADPADQPAALLAAAVQACAETTARWMAAGFVHGVLNTDNMNITGESFDYGPYRFLPHFEPGYTAAYFDHTGLYAFGRQPHAVFWNLQQLGACLSLISEDAPLIAALETFSDAYATALNRAWHARLGVEPTGDRAEDDAFLRDGLEVLQKTQAPWAETFFDHFGGSARPEPARSGPRAATYAQPTWVAWRAQLDARTPDRPERFSAPVFQRPDPVTLSYEDIEAIWEDISERDDWAPFEAKLADIEQLREGLGANGRPG